MVFVSSPPGICGHDSARSEALQQASVCQQERCRAEQRLTLSPKSAPPKMKATYTLFLRMNICKQGTHSHAKTLKCKRARCAVTTVRRALRWVRPIHADFSHICPCATLLHRCEDVWSDKLTLYPTSISGCGFEWAGMAGNPYPQLLQRYKDHQ